jgi:hypothetical protein
MTPSRTLSPGRQCREPPHSRTQAAAAAVSLTAPTSPRDKMTPPRPLSPGGSAKSHRSRRAAATTSHRISRGRAHAGRVRARQDDAASALVARRQRREPPQQQSSSTATGLQQQYHCSRKGSGTARWPSTPTRAASATSESCWLRAASKWLLLDGRGQVVASSGRAPRSALRARENQPRFSVTLLVEGNETISLCPSLPSRPLVPIGAIARDSDNSPTVAGRARANRCGKRTHQLLSSIRQPNAFAFNGRGTASALGLGRRRGRGTHASALRWAGPTSVSGAAGRASLQAGAPSPTRPSPTSVSLRSACCHRKAAGGAAVGQTPNAAEPSRVVVVQRGWCGRGAQTASSGKQRGGRAGGRGRVRPGGDGVGRARPTCRGRGARCRGAVPLRCARAAEQAGKAAGS